MWQDIAIACGSVFFTIALFPSLLSDDKPAIATSIINSSILFLMVIVYASLGLFLASLMNLIMCILWAILAIQQIHAKKTIKL